MTYRSRVSSLLKRLRSGLMTMDIFHKRPQKKSRLFYFYPDKTTIRLRLFQRQPVRLYAALKSDRPFPSSSTIPSSGVTDDLLPFLFLYLFAILLFWLAKFMIVWITYILPLCFATFIFGWKTYTLFYCLFVILLFWLAIKHIDKSNLAQGFRMNLERNGENEIETSCTKG